MHCIYLTHTVHVLIDSTLEIRHLTKVGKYPCCYGGGGGGGGGGEGYFAHLFSLQIGEQGHF